MGLYLGQRDSVYRIGQSGVAQGGGSAVRRGDRVGPAFRIIREDDTPDAVRPLEPFGSGGHERVILHFSQPFCFAIEGGSTGADFSLPPHTRFGAA